MMAGPGQETDDDGWVLTLNQCELSANVRDIPLLVGCLFDFYVNRILAECGISPLRSEHRM